MSAAREMRRLLGLRRCGNLYDEEAAGPKYCWNALSRGAGVRWSSQASVLRQSELDFTTLVTGTSEDAWNAAMYVAFDQFCGASLDTKNGFPRLPTTCPSVRQLQER
ncbi:hypothetical protein FB451DRAFT_1169186 [Mycena latifolia]|nr:hypothetical protein FB451DRAFT_1169186 [Mycena latifolia]